MDEPEQTDVQDPGSQDEPLMEVVQDGNTDPSPMEGIAVAEAGPAPEKPQEEEDAGHYTWDLHQFSRVLAPKVHSEVFQIGGHPWRLLIFPQGNKSNFLSAYLDVADAEDQPLGWSRRAWFKLTLINQLDESKSVQKVASHLFTAQAVDWGFTQFHPLDELHNPTLGFRVNDTIKLRVEVKVDKNEPSLLHDSKKETGFVGLKNQGATCYMNSLLQTLYNINYFRQAVYHMPTAEDESPVKSIPLALQSLFFKLQFGDTSVSTKDLTKSFGWDTVDAFMQHDVQELNRVLCDNLETKMKDTQVQGAINKLFEGHTINFIECVNVDCKSSRKESYMDLSLDVKGCKDVYQSFEKYTEQEMLNGQNQYQTEKFGLQDARKGVLFDSFPPVLQLQLKRFEYDYQRDTLTKINDRYEFPDELDLDVGDHKLLHKDADKSVPNKYKLHSVLVHSGGVHGGHYYAYIRPDGKQWLKFDDDKVIKATREQAMNEQFGGEEENPAPGFAQPFRFTKSSNAYMLVYVRESEWHDIMREVTEHDIAEHVRARLKAEAEEKERKRKEKQEAHTVTYMRVAHDQDLHQQIGTNVYFDLVDHEKVQTFRVPKQTPFSEFRRTLGEQLGVPQDRQRLWVWAKRQNHTFRPSAPLLAPADQKPVAQLAKEHNPAPKVYQQVSELRLYLEEPDSPDKSLPPISPDTFILFFKFYDPHKQRLSYAGHMHTTKSTRVEDLHPMMRRRAGLPDSQRLLVFEEIKFHPSLMIEQPMSRMTMHQAQLEDGDILCFQAEPTQEEAPSLPYPTVKDYLEYVRNRQTVCFKRLDQPKEQGLSLELSKENSYEQTCKALAAALNPPLDDPCKLRLTQQSPYTQMPQPQPIKYNGFEKLSQVLRDLQGQSAPELYYEVLDIQLQQLEQLKSLTVFYHNDKAEQASQHTVRVHRDGCVRDVLEDLRKQLGVNAPSTPLRLMEVFQCKVHKVFPEDESIADINDMYWTLRAEAVPKDQAELAETDLLINVCHYQLDQAGHVQLFGNPFFLRISDTDTLEQAKSQVQAKLGVSDEEYAKWKFTFHRHLQTPAPLQDDDVLAARFPEKGTGSFVTGTDAPFLGLQHECQFPHRHRPNRLSHYERPVKIYG